MKLLSLVLLFTLVSCGFETINNGHRGIKVSYGEVVGEPLPEGFHTYNPWSIDIEEVSVLEVPYEYELECYSKDNQPIVVNATVTAAPTANDVGRIYKKNGDIETYMNTVVSKEIVGGIKDMIGQYTADDIVSQREELRRKTVKYLKAKLEERMVTVSGVDFANLKFDDAYERAVQLKVTAIQHAEAAKNKTVQIAEEKKQTILTAEGAAEAMRIKANALASNPKLVEYEWVQKWDGKTPTHVFGNSVPMVNLK